MRVVQLEAGRTWAPGQLAGMPEIWHFGGGSWDKGGATFPEATTSRYVEVDALEGWRLRFEILYSSDDRAPVVGYAEIDITDLARREHWRLLLSDPDTGDPIYGADQRSGDKQCVRPPSFLQVRTDGASAPPRGPFSATPQPLLPASTKSWMSHQFYPTRSMRSGKRVQLLCRGTRGDVQPYLALALGLVKFCECEVTIVTELVWKGLIHTWRKKLPEELQKMFHFRPSGGDTMRVVNSGLVSLALRFGHKINLLQNAALARTEQTFLCSEGCFFHWAQEEAPDYIVFAFPITHVAMIISEALRIPLVAFLLQPLHEIAKAPQADGYLDAALEPLRVALMSETFNAYAMQFMHMIPDEGITFDELRTSRGLQPFPAGIAGDFPQHTELANQGIPQLVPISSIVLGSERAMELEERGMQLTDFIFLRNERSTLPLHVQGFIDKARASQRSVVCMTMSSMPVGMRRLLQVAVAVCQECKVSAGPNGEFNRPVFIACLGGQTLDPPDEALQTEVSQLEAEGCLLLVKDALDFAVLFQQLDAVILHGGLGVTAEAIAAGIPVIVSGILLLDQRFWAHCIKDLGCGPEGSYIDDLLIKDEAGKHKVSGLVERALMQGGANHNDVVIPCDGSSNCHEASVPVPWSAQAKRIKEAIEAACDPKDSKDGVTQNARLVHEAGLQAKVVRDPYTRNRTRFRLQWLCMCVRCLCDLILFIRLCQILKWCSGQFVRCLEGCCCPRKDTDQRAFLAPQRGAAREMVSLKRSRRSSVQMQRSRLLSEPLTAWVVKDGDSQRASVSSIGTNAIEAKRSRGAEA